MVSLRDIAPFQRLNRADDRWSFSWDTGAGENALVGAQSVSRRNGFDLRDREYVQVGVYRVCATGKISLTASWSFEWIFEWRDQRSGPGSGNLSLWPEAGQAHFCEIARNHLRDHQVEPASCDLHLESLELVHHQAFGFGLALQPDRILRRVENTRSGRPSGFQSRSLGFVSLDRSAVDCPGRNTG